MRNYQECVKINIQKQVEELFKDYLEKDDIDALVLASKNGIPIAAHIRRKDRSESFSALSATIMGASEVIFSGLDKETPDMVEIGSENCVMFIKGMGRSSVLSLLGKLEKRDDLKETLLEIESKINDIKNLESERGN